MFEADGVNFNETLVFPAPLAVIVNENPLIVADAIELVGLDVIDKVPIAHDI